MEEKKDKVEITISIVMVIITLIFIISSICLIVVAIKKNNENETEKNEVALQNTTSQESISQVPTNVSENNDVEIIDPNASTENQVIENNTNETNSSQTEDNQINTKIYKTEETIPFKVTGGKISEGDLNTGLTIEDANGNKWVWIEVPKSITQEATTDEEIEQKLLEYTKKDVEGNEFINNRNENRDINYEGTGITDEQYNQKKSKMLQCIKNNGGFYIGKYETGYELQENTKIREGGDSNTTYPLEQKPVIKSGAAPYNWVNCSQAEKIAEYFSTEDITASLMFGIQWDLTLKYLNTKGIKSDELISNSTDLGNYNNNGTGKISKTGNPKYLGQRGCFDLAGNVWEWTLEKSSNSEKPSVVRGGDYTVSGDRNPLSYRGNVKLNVCSKSVGLRCTMY